MSVGKTCENCGAYFVVPKRRELTAKFCSKECRAKGVGAMLKGTPLTNEHIEKLSAVLKAKWESGTRKPTPPEAYAKSSNTLKELFAQGILKSNLTREAALRGLAARDPVKLQRNCRALAVAKLNVPNPPGPSAKGEGHICAKYWELHGPNGEHLIGKNLTELVRQNEHLFDASDLNWDRMKIKCRATKGLRHLFAGKDAPKSWKGWRAGLKNSRKD